MHYLAYLIKVFKFNINFYDILLTVLDNYNELQVLLTAFPGSS